MISSASANRVTGTDNCLQIGGSNIAGTGAKEYKPGRDGNERSQALLIAWLILIMLSSLYLVTTKGFSDITNAEAYYLITESIVERGWVDLLPGTGLTENIFDARWIIHADDGRIYSQYWLGYPIFQIPWYVAGKWAGQALSALRPELAPIAHFLPRIAINLAGSFITAATASLLFLLLMSLGLPLSYSAVTVLLYGVATYGLALRQYRLVRAIYHVYSGSCAVAGGAV